MKLYRVLTVLPLLTACVTAPDDGPRTLGDLDGEAPPEVPAGSSPDRGQAITGYREFLDKAEDPVLKAEAMRRLADLSLEEREARTADNPGKEAPESEGERIIRLYEQRLEAYPYHPQNDQVLYQLSRAYENHSRPEDALATLDRLVSQYPFSPVIAEAQFRRGEMLFVRKRYREADDAYRAVLGKGPSSGFYEQALYKRGWSLFKQSLYLEGIDLFLELIDRKSVAGRLEPDQLPRAEREMIEDTLRAISLSFSYLDGPETVQEYFRSRGHRKDEDVLYRALGDQYLAKERYSDAAATYQAYVAAYPNSDFAPSFQLDAIDAYRKGDFPSQVLEAQKAYVRLFDLRSPYWGGRQPEDHPQVVAQLQSSLRDLARHFHARAQEDKKAEDYAAAGDWYRRYLVNFPDSAGAQELRFLYAELLFEQEAYPEAVEQYEHVAYRYSHNGRAGEAAYAAVVAYARHAETLSGEAARDWQRRALASIRRFAAEFPQHPEAGPSLTLGVQRAFDQGDGELAGEAAEELLALPGADAKAGLTAWIVLGHTAFDRGDFLRSEQAYRQALASPALGEAKIRRDLGDRLAASIYQQADRRRQGGDLAGAVEDFLRAAEAVPDSEIRATAEFDAAAVLAELEQWPRAAEVLESFRRHFPKHPKTLEVQRRLAVAYENSGDKTAAAREFAELAAQSPDGEVQRESLWRSAQLHREGGAGELAAEVLHEYLERFPDPLEPAMEARAQLLELALARDDAQDARHWRQEIIAADARAGPARSERTRFLAAQASLAIARDLERRYQAVALVEPLQTNLRRKKARLQEALDAFGRAGEYAVAGVTTAASFAVADLYADFGRALLESERPGDLRGEALAEYELLLEEEALPFEDKAIEIHELNTRRAREGVYDEWVRKSYDELARLMPVRYAKAERSDDLVEAIY